MAIAEAMKNRNKKGEGEKKNLNKKKPTNTSRFPLY